MNLGNLSIHRMPRRLFSLFMLAALVVVTGLPAALTPTAHAATTVVVTPPAMNNWIFFTDDAPVDEATGSFTLGPATPPLGTGSARLTLDNTTTARLMLLTPMYAGTRLDEITSLKYSTYRHSADPGNLLALSLQIGIDFDVTDGVLDFQGRLVYEPYFDIGSGNVPQNTWQTWDAISPTARWWATRAPFNISCSQATPCTWAEVKSNWPNAGIHPFNLFGILGVKAGGPASGFDSSLDQFVIGVNGEETIYDFEPETQCTTICYVSAIGGDDSFGGATPDRAKKTIQAALDQVSPGGTVQVSPGTYTEALTITKAGVTLKGAGKGNNPDQHTIVDGPVGSNAGIRLPSTGLTNVTIRDLRVQDFTGGGICSIGANNNNLTIDSVEVANIAISGGCQAAIYANGPISDVLITNSHVSNITGRGITIWNGFKQRITITDNVVENANCCGIELQDGTASGVTMTGNTVRNSGDSGMSAIGLTSRAGPNVISGNTLINNGRFGIEIKMPNGTGLESGDGSIVVSDNTVLLDTPFSSLRPAELRDIAGIVVIRRGYSAGQGYADIPNGVVVKNNTVSGYVQDNAASSSEGFGIVVEGRAMSVYGNTVTGNDVGIQRQSGHLPYTPNTNVDGDQSNLADTYFGRGNSPITCALIGANTLSGNGVDQRDVTPICDTLGGLVFSVHPANTPAGSPIGPVSVTVLGQDGEPFTSYTGPVSVTLGANPGNDTLGGTLEVNAVAGVATFSDLVLEKAAAGYTLVAHLDALPTATSQPFTILGGAPTQIEFSTQPGGAPAGSPLDPQPVVTLYDAYGNVATYSGAVTLALGANPASATLGGTTSVQVVDGVATFTDVTVSAEGTGYTLVASVAGLNGTSAPFDVTGYVLHLPVIMR